MHLTVIRVERISNACYFFLLNLYATDPKAINTSAEITSI